MPEGYRGYITSRPVCGSHFPQRIQNLVVRDYAARRKLPYLLSLTEYAMPGSYMMFEQLLDELDDVDGVVLFSMFTLPSDRARRRRFYERALAAGKTIHAALEQLALKTPADARHWDDVINLELALHAAPFGGRYEKNGKPLGSDAQGEIARFGL